MCETILRWPWTNRPCVCIDVVCTHWDRNCTPMSCVNTLQWRPMVHDSWLILIFVKYTERYRSCWLWTNREYVALVLVSCMQTYGWWMNLNVSLLGYDVLVPWKTRSRLRTRLLLFTHTTINDNYTRPRINFDVEWIHGTVSCYKRTASTLTLVHVWTWICHCLVYDAPWHHRNYTLARYSTIMAMTYGSAVMLIGYMERYHIDFGRTDGTLVLVYVWIWMYVQLLDIRCTMTPLRLHTRLLFKCNGNYIRYGSAVMLIGYMERYHIDFGRTGGTLVLVHVWIWMCNCLVYDAPWHHRNCTPACYSNTMAITYHTALRWCWSDIWNGMILTLDEQKVR